MVGKSVEEVKPVMSGGPLALVQDGDEIELDVARRSLRLLVPENELALRKPPPSFTESLAAPDRGWTQLYVGHVGQADTGADLDFLVGASGATPMRDSH